jgi:hypothetical protein
MRRAQLQAVALRAIAERVESGTLGLTGELTSALAHELEARPELAEEVEAFEEIEGAPPAWHLEELARCEREDSGGEAWDVVRARILARGQRRSA